MPSNVKGYITRYRMRDLAKTRALEKVSKGKSRLKKISEVGVTQDSIRTEKLRNEGFLLMGNKCMVCGMRDSRCFQFHHPNFDGNERRRENNASGRNAVSYRAVILDFILDPSSIQLLCANCHVIAHDDEKKAKRARKRAEALAARRKTL